MLMQPNGYFLTYHWCCTRWWWTWWWCLRLHDGHLYITEKPIWWSCLHDKVISSSNQWAHHNIPISISKFSSSKNCKLVQRTITCPFMFTMTIPAVWKARLPLLSTSWNSTLSPEVCYFMIVFVKFIKLLLIKLIITYLKLLNSKNALNINCE